MNDKKRLYLIGTDEPFFPLSLISEKIQSQSLKDLLSEKDMELRRKIDPQIPGQMTASYGVIGKIQSEHHFAVITPSEEVPYISTQIGPDGLASYGLTSYGHIADHIADLVTGDIQIQEGQVLAPWVGNMNTLFLHGHHKIVQAEKYQEKLEKNNIDVVYLLDGA